MVGMEGPDGPPSVVGADDTVGAGEIVGNMGPPPLLLPFPVPLPIPFPSPLPLPPWVGIVVGEFEGVEVGAIVAMQVVDVPNLSHSKVQSSPVPSKQPIPRTTRPSRLSVHCFETKSGLT
jgi:hypothetical protein